ncbi:class I SAM-dependent methyltransferase [Gilvimarinus algae]|uniref:Class I SAM-dependent methyltransferase n=1 Tax=Gilvimarinus algae TaxID=3058037 RepID=A0ABT8TAX3_9GAMM|nr:class I SAM-dependent methyltransferase [Gilvimarinus sp. SDUM040014]MDO3381096.1 class I SAM-dependent methyltransferase [Gilvimarinus sp. SDUM040014]
MVRRNLKFWDFIAKRYARQAVPSEEQYQHKLEKTREFFTKDCQVFEFGCGTGTTALAHAPYTKSILAVDVSRKMLEIAEQKRQAQAADNVSFQQATIEELAFEPASFDVVMAHNILHLLDDKEAAIAKVYQWLKPGGVFVSTNVCLGDRMTWWRPLLGFGRLIGVLPLVRFFSEQSLEDTLREAGFETEYRWQPKAGDSLFLVVRKSTH